MVDVEQVGRVVAPLDLHQPVVVAAVRGLEAVPMSRGPDQAEMRVQGRLSSQSGRKFPIPDVRGARPAVSPAESGCL